MKVPCRSLVGDNSHYLVPIMETKPTANSAQTVARAIHLLRLVASSRSRHLRLIDLAQMAGLEKSTTHRLLQRLVQERMLVREAGQRGYRLGPLLYELGLAALPQSNLRQVSQVALKRLAETSGDMAFLLIRSGYDAVCLDRIAGNFAIQTMTTGVGDRHPLGVGAGGLAIMAALSDSEVDVTIKVIVQHLGHYNLSEPALRESIERTRQRGYALDEDAAALDVTAMGMAIRNPAGSPVGAVFVASISGRMNEARRVDVAKKLAACVRSIELALQR